MNTFPLRSSLHWCVWCSCHLSSDHPVPRISFSPRISGKVVKCSGPSPCQGPQHTCGFASLFIKSRWRWCWVKNLSSWVASSSPNCGWKHFFLPAAPFSLALVYKSCCSMGLGREEDMGFYLSMSKYALNACLFRWWGHTIKNQNNNKNKTLFYRAFLL